MTALSGRNKRPLAEAAGADEVDQSAGDGDCRGYGQFNEGVAAVDQHEDESRKSDERR